MEQATSRGPRESGSQSGEKQLESEALLFVKPSVPAHAEPAPKPGDTMEIIPPSLSTPASPPEAINPSVTKGSTTAQKHSVQNSS